MKLYVGILLIIVSAKTWAEWEDGSSSVGSFLVSQQELESIRNQELPENLRQKSKKAFRKEVDKLKTSLKEWAESVQVRRISALCIGETHSDIYRKLIGEQVLPLLRMDSLSVEMVQEELDELVAHFDVRSSVEHLGADFTSILKAAWTSGLKPESLFAIEQTKKQELAALKEKISSPEERFLTRDGFIAKNFLEKYNPAGLNVILYGANHCSNFDKGLPLEVPMFRRIKNVIGSERTESVLVLPLSKRSHPVVAYFATAGGGNETMVVPNFKTIPSDSFNHRFELIKYQQNYDTIILMKDRKL